jgi:alkylation response protein AidB-like acyl-CoA dehydrogenase
VQSSTLEAIQALAPDLAAAADETEENRSLPAAVVDKLREAGLFRMFLPKRYGGDALTQGQAVAVIEALGAVDAAAAWTGMVAFGFNTVMSRFPQAVTDKVFADGPDAPIRGALAPIGRATVVEGGYLISGQWPFASGPYKPEWVMAGAVVFEGGAPKMGPGGPEIRLTLVPAETVEFLDTWRSVGLRGSDSRDFKLQDVFVPEDHAVNVFDPRQPIHFEDPIYHLPFPVVTGPTHSAVCLGAVRGALDDLAELARTKRSAFSPAQTLGESPIFQHRLGELAVRHAAIQALTDHQVDDVARMVATSQPPTPLIVSRNASWVGYVHQQAVDIVNEAFSLAGSTPVYTKSPLQRRWRDVRVAAQHFGGSTGQYPVYGGLLAGQPPRPPGL